MRRRFRHLGAVERVVYALLCAAWIYAYFPTIQHLGLLNDPKTFLPFLGFLALSFSLPWWWVQVLAALVAMFGYVDLYWRPAGDSLSTGFLHVSSGLWQEFVAVLHRQPYVDPLQTFTFFAGTVVVYWLVFYASHRSHLWLFYNILGVAVLAVIDGNTKVHPNGAIVALILIWAIVLGVNQLRRMHRFAPPNSRPVLRFVSPLVLLLALCSTVGFAAPKALPAWPNPFGRSSGGSGNGTLKTIGYQLNNSRLGGSFVSNNQLVLQLVSPFATYLRGETLSTYTGKGWASAPLTDAQMLKGTVGVPFADADVSSYTFHGLPTKQISQTVSLQTNTVNTSDLLGGYAIDEVLKLPDTYGERVSADTVQGNIRGPKLSLGQSYEVQSKVLSNPYHHLAQETTPFAVFQGNIPTNVRQYDLQLPSEMPPSIGTLATHIVQQSHAKTEYQIVQALEAYLKKNDTYQTTDIPIPGKGQDYVAQFLFQSKHGYCNNFSTSLAIMLRTLGVPTRWVTGYTSGTLNTGDSSIDNNHTYDITNNDAHSWVEVYFPKYGFIPFDPTPSFTIPFAQSSASTSAATANTTVAPQPKTPSTPPSSPATPNVSMARAGLYLKGLLYIAGALVILALLAYGLLQNRFLFVQLERQWNRDPARGLRRAQRLLTRALIRRRGGDPHATLRELWPVASEAGIGATDYTAWVRTIERVEYGGETLPRQQAIEMRAMTIRWLQSIYRETFSWNRLAAKLFSWRHGRSKRDRYGR